MPIATAPELDARTKQARRITQQASKLALQFFEAPERLEAQLKGHQDWVTKADRAVEAFVQEQLHKSFPGESFLGEESGHTGSNDAVWVCDPIDGTQNFMRGIPTFGITLAFVSQGRTLVGVTEEPAFGRTYSARQGGGAFLDDTRLHIRPDCTLSKAVLGLGYNANRDPEEFLKYLARLFELGTEFRRIGSAAICLAYVASGKLDAFWQMHLKSWDVISGLLLVQEAGGLACDFLSQDGLTTGNPVLAGAPGVIAQLSEALDIPIIGGA